MRGYDRLLYPISPVEQHPDKVAFSIVETGESVTFKQLEERSNQAAHLFRSCGVQRGGHIVLLSENCRQFLEICFAADRAGLYYTAISTHATAGEAVHIAAHCGVSLWIVSAAKAEIAEALSEELPEIAHCFMIGESIAGCERWDAAIAAQPGTRIADEHQGLDMLYSSGTTGCPKGIRREQA